MILSKRNKNIFEMTYWLIQQGKCNKINQSIVKPLDKGCQPLASLKLIKVLKI